MLLKKGFPKNTAVISFYDPPGKFHDENYCPVDYKGKTARLFQVAVHDIDLSVLPEYGLNYNTYFTEASALAEFIFEAHQDGLDIICQCEYGESRSSGLYIPFNKCTFSGNSEHLNPIFQSRYFRPIVQSPIMNPYT